MAFNTKNSGISGGGGEEFTRAFSRQITINCTFRFSYLTFFGLFSESFFMKYLRLFIKKITSGVQLRVNVFSSNNKVHFLDSVDHWTNFLSFIINICHYISNHGATSGLFLFLCQIFLDSVHFKKTVVRNSFLSKLWYFQYKSKQKVPQFWKKRDWRIFFLKWTDFSF